MAIYTIMADDKVLSNPKLRDRQLFDSKLTLEVNKTGELKFKIYKTHPHYNDLIKRKTILTVLENSRVIFKGRITEDTKDINNGKQVDCEGLLAFLNDSMYKPFSFQGSPRDFFISLIENHNSQVQDFQKFKIGDITIKDKNDYINRESKSYLKTWEVIKTRLLDTLGGYLCLRYEEDGMYIDYLEDFVIENEDGTTSKIVSAQKIEFGVNLLSISQKVKAPLATAIVPLGAKTKNGDVETELTISSIPDEELDDLVKKGDTIYSKSGVAKYGWIYDEPKNTTWQDVTVAENLYRKGKEYLSGTAVKLSETISLTAVDLQNLNANIDNFHFCEYIRVFSKSHDIDQYYLLSKITIDLSNPQNTKITLGETKLTLTDKNVSTNREVSDSVKKIEIIEKNYVTNQSVGTIVNQTLEESTIIQQKATEIVLQALTEYVKNNDFSEYQETNSTDLQILAEQIIANFNTTTSQIENANGNIQQIYQELSSHIRGYQNSEGQPVVELGDNQSNIKLKLENDEIYFDVNGQKRFYLTADGKIVFKNAIFEETTQVGNGFGFVPRSNGNLSFKKVV